MLLHTLEVRYIIFVLLFPIFIGCTTNSTNLQWHKKGNYKWAEVSLDYFEEPGFEKLNDESTNVQFINNATKKSISDNRNYLNGSGVAAADIDRDGWVDLYFAQLDGTNKLYKNMGGMRFKDITKKAGLEHEGYNSTGVIFADVDGDKDQDLLVSSLTEQNVLYINNGKGKFELKKNSGLGKSKGSTSMTLADIDGDKDLDLYITNYKLKSVRDIYPSRKLSLENTTKKQGDSLIVIPPYDKYYGMIQTDNRSYRNEYGEEDELYINKGGGLFHEVKNTERRFLNEDGEQMGLPKDWGLTAKFKDVNGDMLPDLYVANDFWTPDRFWINKGKGIFQEIDQLAVRSQSYASMGVAFSDLNKDGNVDIFVTEMLSDLHSRRMRQVSQYLDPIDGRPQYNRNSLYLNSGNNTYAEISYFSKIAASEWSWATSFLDVNLDGHEDLIITTGHEYDYQDMDTQFKLYKAKQQGTLQGSENLFSYPTLKLQNKIFKNNQNLTFTDFSSEWGFTEKDVSQGMAIADLDNDGDSDLVINRLNDTALIYQNKSNAPRIAVRLKGAGPNVSAIGAKIKLLGATSVQQREIAVGGNYLSGSQPMAFFAAKEGKDHTLEIIWPDGKISKIDSVRANRIYIVDEESSIAQSENNAQSAHIDKKDKTLFKDISDRINHTHHENLVNDFKIQPLLPVKLNRKGPGLSWFDYDKDDDDDLFITSGTGGTLDIFENIRNNQFKKTEFGSINDIALGDQTTVLGWNQGDKSILFVGNANYEQGNPRVPSAYHYSINSNQNIQTEEIPGIFSTTGPLAAADYTSDGKIDLFVGGNFLPTKYPQDASSRFFKNGTEGFQLDQANSEKAVGIGLISSAVFTDYDQDGDSDLLLGREWDSILLLENRKGRFIDASSKVGLNTFKGWWRGIATGDFNNDGLPDIVATNIGKNSIYQVKGDSSLKLFHRDFNRDGKHDIVDSYYDQNLGGYVPRRKLYDFDSLPQILRNIKSHEEFANSTVDKIFGQNFEAIPYKEITTTSHMIFLNKGGYFAPKSLPDEAQWSIGCDISVADFDNDGNEDLFMSQNLFVFPPGIPRIGAGRGLILKGNGKGDFQAVQGHRSGIKLYGGQRAAAVSDFNEDGKTDLAVSQNKGDTHLYINQIKTKGIIVELVGHMNNPDAIGSSIRLVYKDGRKGPLREIQAGSGYWSQDSFTQILGASQTPIKLEIQWYDGKKEMINLDSRKLKYEVKR